MNTLRKNKSVLLILLLSLFPGLPQIYLGEKRKGLMLLIITAGILATVISSKSYLMRLLMAGIYLVTALPSAIESYQVVKYGEKKFDINSRWYITIMLFCTGFSALPLLWNSDKFSKRLKIAWTIGVPLLAFLFFSFLIKYWNWLEDALRKFINA